MEQSVRIGVDFGGTKIEVAALDARGEFLARVRAANPGGYEAAIRTVCDLVGAKVPDGLDGQSQRAVIEGRSEGVRDTLFFAYRDFQRAVRDGRYKLIRYPQVDVTQLFDLHSDPHELLNLAGDSEQTDRIAALTAEMHRWQKDLGDTAPLVVANPQDAAFMPPQD